jgi:outer membrane protein assembly factor BamB
MKLTSTSAKVAQPCPEWATQLSALHREDLPFEERLKLRRHLETCPGCTAVKAEYRALDAQLIALPPVAPLAYMPARLQELTGVHEEVDSLPQISDPQEMLTLLPLEHAADRRSNPRLLKLRTKLNLLAAVIMIAAIVGGFLLLSTAHHPSSFASQHSTPLYFVTDEAKSVVYAINSSDGSIIWRYTLGQKPVNQAVFVNGRLFFSSYDGNIYALRASDGQPLWHTRVASGNEHVPTGLIQAYNNLIFTATNDGSLYALNAQTGAVVWHTRNAACPTDGSNPAEKVTQQGQITMITLTGQPDPCNVVTLRQSNGIVYGFSGDLSAWNATDGHLLWHNARYHSNTQLIAIAHTKLYLQASPLAAGHIDVLDMGTGHFLHTLGSASPPTRFPLEIAADSNTLYVSGTGSLSAYRLSDDTLLWKKEKSLANLSPSNGRLYTTSSSINSTGSSANPMYAIDFYALKGSSGTQIWHVHIATARYFAPLFEVNGIVIAISDTGLHAYQASNGRQLWQGFQHLSIQAPVAG